MTHLATVVAKSIRARVGCWLIDAGAWLLPDAEPSEEWRLRSRQWFEECARRRGYEGP